MVTLDLSELRLRLQQEAEKTLVFDPVRKKWLKLTPEEHVRQYILQFLLQRLQYPASLIAVEKKILVGKMNKRFDIVVFDRSYRPWMLIECKEPQVPISEQTLFQLLQYNRTLSCKYWVLSNGHETFCAEADTDMNITWLNTLPTYQH